MKIALLALSLAAVAGSTFAADAPRATSTSDLMRAAGYLESRYGGEVVAIALDDAGDKPTHYHVDMRFIGGDVAKLDFDAATREIAGRDYTSPPGAAITLAEAATRATSMLPGEVVGAQLDVGHPALTHYDVDVRLPRGDIARVKIDPQTGQLNWRTPPVVAH